MRKRSYTDEEIFKWYEKYKECGSTKKTASSFNVCSKTVLTKFKLLNLKIIKKKSKYSDEEVFEWYEKYKECKNTHKVGAFFKVAADTVRARFKSLDFKVNKKRKYTDKEVFEWYEKYKIVKSTEKVGIIYGVNSATVYHNFKREGFSLFESTVGKRIRKYDDDFFERDTPESFYWAGFIAADGCVHINKNSNSKYLSIILAKKDHNHLKKFVTAIHFDGLIKERTRKDGGGSVSMAICSNKIFDDLSRFNIVPRKTFIYTFPKWIITHPLVNHFIRGYFDGDGSVWKQRGKNRSKLLFGFCGTFKFLKECRGIFGKIELNPHVKIRMCKNIYQLEYAGNKNAIKFRDFLYKNATDDIFLNRKRERFYNDWIDNKPRSVRCKSVVGTSLADDSKIPLEAISDGKNYGFSRCGISSCLIGKQKSHRGYTWEYVENKTQS